jgi:hypothetical protein
LALVAAWLAEFGGRANAEPPHIQWQSPGRINESPTAAAETPGTDRDTTAAPRPADLADVQVKRSESASEYAGASPTQDLSDSGARAAATGPPVAVDGRDQAQGDPQVRAERTEEAADTAVTAPTADEPEPSDMLTDATAHPPIAPAADPNPASKAREHNTERAERAQR